MPASAGLARHPQCTIGATDGPKSLDSDRDGKRPEHARQGDREEGRSTIDDEGQGHAQGQGQGQVTPHEQRHGPGQVPGRGAMANPFEGNESLSPTHIGINGASP